MKVQFEPRDKNFEYKVVESFNHQEVMKTVKASIVSVFPGEVELQFPFQDSLTQQHGFIHAGIISTVLDSACGYAAFSLMSADAAVLTIEFKVNLLSPAKGDNFIAKGKVIKPGKNITVATGEMFAQEGNKQKLVASMSGTLMSVYNKDGVHN